jgi:hypothetical protein
MMGKTNATNIDDIVVNERCQTREILNPEAVQEYADIYKEGEVKLPALEVCDVDGKLVLIDGFHRLAGARQADQSFIRVTIVEECDMDRALWLASAANQGHGVRRTSADKRQAVRLALDSGIGVDQSTHILAGHVGVDHKTAQKHRDEWEAELKTAPGEALGKIPNAPEMVKTKDGREYPKRRRKNSDATSDRETTPAGTAPQTDDAPPKEPVSNTEEDGDYKAAARRLRRVYDRLCASLSLTDPVCKKVNEAIQLAEERAR